MEDFGFEVNLVITHEHVNQRNHVSYDKYFVLFQEARLGYLALCDFLFDDSQGVGLIAAEAHCVYKKELRQGDHIAIGCRIRTLKPKAFEMEFQITRDGEVCAFGETTYFCYDYANRRVAPLPDVFVRRVRAHEGNL